MLIGYGFPKVFNAGVGKDEEWLYLAHDLLYIVAVSASAVQVWSSGLHRVRLSQVVRSEADVEEDGTNLCAYWCPSKATLAVLVRGAGQCAPLAIWVLRSNRPEVRSPV